MVLATQSSGGGGSGVMGRSVIIFLDGLIVTRGVVCYGQDKSAASNSSRYRCGIEMRVEVGKL